ncbi:uncharacterized protein Bfra_003606 [Botrytis fragariae]|uniref:Uncharacterized protein n=1 Tax=Botrytis fragariae TaxID=1964551 RepID=A0A8H6AWM8_9HELO|nr:uncharacterized protein Bfra_003606 [Botrytis fragariae]KAF5875153.1 hypothetical protein Bfra_003606 [Botrytis fragariae]
MASPNNMQSIALNTSEKEHSRNSTSDTDDGDEMPAITNAVYIAELKQRIVDLDGSCFAYMHNDTTLRHYDITTFTIQYDGLGYDV